MKPETLSKNLTRSYEYIRSAEHVDGKELSEVAADIGRSVLKQSVQKDAALTQEYKDLKIRSGHKDFLDGAGQTGPCGYGRVQFFPEEILWSH